MSDEKKELKHCPICITTWLLHHHSLKDYKKCGTCGFAYKLGEEKEALEIVRAMRKSESQEKQKK